MAGPFLREVISQCLSRSQLEREKEIMEIPQQHIETAQRSLLIIRA